MEFQYLSKERKGDVFVITMRRAPENRLNVQFCQELIRAYREAEKELGTNSEGAVILRGSDAKFFCTVRFKISTHGLLSAGADPQIREWTLMSEKATYMLRATASTRYV